LGRKRKILRSTAKNEQIFVSRQVRGAGNASAAGVAQGKLSPPGDENAL
jgi:hypothetical protein